MVAVTMCGPAAIVEQPILDGRPARAISYLDPIADWDSGYAVFASEPGDDTDTTLVCLHCPIDEHPELGRGLDLARQHGEAIRSMTVGGRCQPGAISSFEQPRPRSHR